MNIVDIIEWIFRDLSCFHLLPCEHSNSASVKENDKNTTGKELLGFMPVKQSRAWLVDWRSWFLFLRDEK